MIPGVDLAAVTGIAGVAGLLVVAIAYRNAWLLPVGVLVLLPALPVKINAITVGQAVYNLTLFDVSTGLFLLGLVLHRNAVRQAKRRTPQSLWRVASAGFVLIVLLMAFNGLANVLYQPRENWMGSSLLMFRTYCQAYFLPLFVVVFIRERSLKGLAVLFLGFAYVGLAQAAIEGPLSELRAEPFGMNPNAFGQALALIFVSAGAIYLNRWGDRVVATLSPAAAFSAALGIVVCGSREALVGAAAGALVLFIETSRREHRRGIATKLLVAALLFGTAWIVTSNFRSRYENDVFKRMEGILEARNLGVDVNFTARKSLSHEALLYYAKEPLFPFTGRGLPARETEMLYIEDADSSFINTINCVGVVGLGGILWFLGRLWGLPRLLERKGAPKRGGWTPGVHATVVTYCVLGLAGNVFGSPHTTIVFLLTVFLPLVEIGAARKWQAATVEPEQGQPPTPDLVANESPAAISA